MVVSSGKESDLDFKILIVSSAISCLLFSFIIMTIPFAALKAQKGMKLLCRNADFKIMC